MECIAKKHAEECINKLWSEIDEEIKKELMQIVNKDYQNCNKKDGLITFGDMPFEIEARLVDEGRDIIAKPYKTSRMILKGNLDEYYYNVINNIIDEEYNSEEYTFIGVKKFVRFLIDNLEAEQVELLCENTKEQLKWELCNVIDSIKAGKIINNLSLKIFA